MPPSKSSFNDSSPFCNKKIPDLPAHIPREVVTRDLIILVSHMEYVRDAFRDLHNGVYTKEDAAVLIETAYHETDKVLAALVFLITNIINDPEATDTADAQYLQSLWKKEGKEK